MTRARTIELAIGLVVIVVASIAWVAVLRHAASTTAPSGTPTVTLATAAPADIARPTPTWQTIAAFTGASLDSSGYTPAFTVPTSPWRVAWTCTSTLEAVTGYNVSWNIYRPDGTLVVPDAFTEACVSGNTSGIQPISSPAGTYRINVGSNGSWELDIQAAA